MKKIQMSTLYGEMSEKPKVQGAPQWLIDRMEALKKLPPPTLEEVETSFRASEKWRKENLG